MVQTPLKTTSPQEPTDRVSADKKKPSKLEVLKEQSNFLREPVASELLQETTHFTENAIQISSFTGLISKTTATTGSKGQEKDYQMMLRTRNPGGYIPPELYLTLDRLSDQYGNHTCGLPPDRAFQLHGILKKISRPPLRRLCVAWGLPWGLRRPQPQCHGSPGSL
jgi:sulfite reductase (ferredoxin)